MAVRQSDMLERTAERLLRQAFEQAESETIAVVGVAVDAAPASSEDDADEQEPTDAELAELSAEEEDALYGKGAGH